MATRPILIFDSGVGGLSVVGAIRALLPNAPLVYAADSAGYPYGTKSAAEIEARVPALLGRLSERFDPELIVIACNTASTIALDAVRAALDVAVVGTVPAIKPAAALPRPRPHAPPAPGAGGARRPAPAVGPAAALSRTRAIAVLGTEATVRQGYVDRLAARFAADYLV